VLVLLRAHTRQDGFVWAAFVGPHIPLGLRPVCWVFSSCVDPTRHDHSRLGLASRLDHDMDLIFNALITLKKNSYLAH